MIKYFFILPLLLSVFASDAQYYKGFDISNSSIPRQEIKDGGPPRDGIPSIDHPRFDSIFQSPVDKKDRVLGVYLNGVAKAYPIDILNYHEIVNDRFRNTPVVVTYCPLCGSGIAFIASVEGQDLTFGVSGLLYNSDVIMYDRESESLWSQMKHQAISGPLNGHELTLVTTENTTFGAWKTHYPNTLVLSEQTGFKRDYSRNPYPDYQNSDEVYFEIAHENADFHPKEMVLGISVGSIDKAYPFSQLKKLKGKTLKDRVNGRLYIVEYNHKNRSGRIYNSNGDLVPAVTTFWFAWYAFHPDTKVYRKKSKN